MSVVVQLGLYDVTAKEDSAASSAPVQPFSLPADLEKHAVYPRRFATLEQDFWALDGSFEVFPDDPSAYPWGVYSTAMSDAQGHYATPVVVDISFTVEHSSSALTLRFYDHFPNQLRVTWYNIRDEVITSGTYEVDALEYIVETPVSGYLRIEMEFLSSHDPYRYIKMHGIDYGAGYTFGEESVIGCAVHEEVDLISATVAANTLELSLHFEDESLSIVNLNSLFYLLQSSQWLNVYRDDQYYGLFYLDRWATEGNRKATFYCNDAIWVLEQSEYPGGIYRNKPIVDLLDDIIGELRIDYALAEELQSETVTGWLPYGSRRDALQQIAFAVRAVVDCSRTDCIRIFRYAPDMYATPGYSGLFYAGIPPLLTPGAGAGKAIPLTRKLLGHTETLQPQVSDVIVTAHKYELDSENAGKELAKGTFGAGTHLIKLRNPATHFSAVRASIVGSDANYVKILVTAANAALEQIIYGTEYIDSAVLFSESDAFAPLKKEVTVTDATLVSQENAQQVATHIFDYYRNRYIDEGSILLLDEKCGDDVALQHNATHKIYGKIVSLDVELTKALSGGIKIHGRVNH